jgi:hypothetical protein
LSFLKKGQFRQGRKKAPKGFLTPWSLHIRSFWKIHLINPPEVRDQVVRLKKKEGITMVKK